MFEQQRTDARALPRVGDHERDLGVLCASETVVAGHADGLVAGQREWCRPLADAGVAYECAVLDGNPVSVILGSAESLDADLIVVGSRGVGGFPELLLREHERTGRPTCRAPCPGGAGGGLRRVRMHTHFERHRG